MGYAKGHDPKDYLRFGMSIEYVVAPQRGPLSLYIQLKGPSIRNLGVELEGPLGHFTLEVNAKGRGKWSNLIC